MSHFSTILKNLVASGMTNTNSALVVLESFFEKNDPNSSDMTVQYRGNIADTNAQIASGLISEQDAQLAFAKVKAHTLDLIKKVDDTQFDDAIIINYFAMLSPNPAKDPYFSPIATEEQAVKAIAQNTPSATEFPKTGTESGDSTWMWIIGGIGLLFVIGLISMIIGFGTCTTSPQPSGLAAMPQSTVATKPTDVNKTATTTTAQPSTATSNVTTPAAKPLPEKPPAPKITIKPAAAREKVELIVDSLTTVNNTLNLKVAELKKSNAQLIELTKLAEKDASQAPKRDAEKKNFTALSDEIRVLRSEIKRLTASLPK